jgi:hypothetical protein
MLNERRAQEEKYSRINRLKILNQWRGSRARVAVCSCHQVRPRPPGSQGFGPERAPRTPGRHPSRPGPSWQHAARWSACARVAHFASVDHAGAS